jgi:uncharacterized membrane protein YcaP (DUF421 family)
VFFDDWYGLLRVVVVGPLAYIALVLLLRASGKRTLSKMNAFDFIVTVALGSTLASIILTESVALVEGIVGLALLIGLQFVITWLSVRSGTVARLVKDEPSLLYHRGRFLDAQLKRTRVTRSEVQAAVRQQGHMALTEVDAVVLETDGSFSVMATTDSDGHNGRPVGVPQP